MNQATRGHHFSNIALAKSEAEIQPNAMTDELRGKLVTLI
jgi:hypothetical protein